tara:strand:+ start:6511 stop:7377 length:867 start_codon:yes stop_codon:yes gene_type:complete
MKVTISGSSGFIGQNLINFLSEKNYKTSLLIRDNKKHYPKKWDPENNYLDDKLINNSDVIVNLNGNKIIGSFPRKKISELKNSRINPTKTLINTIAKSKKPPKLLISASACGFYGNRPNEILTESSPRGRGVLSDLVNDWESIQNLKNTRIIFLRLGSIISPQSPMIKNMKRFSSIFGINRLGPSRNFFPWISLLDTLRAINHIIKNESLSGPINLTSEKTSNLKNILDDINLFIKPVLKFPVNQKIISLAFGEIGKELFLNDQNVTPSKLLKSNFKWEKTSIYESLT